MKIKILVADDHRLFRQGLISLMATNEELVEVVGEAETGQDAVRMAAELHPDVVLMDVYMPQGNGLEALKEIHARFPEIRVVMLTSSEDDKHLFEAVKLGASGYLLKNLDSSDLFELLTGVMQGEAALTKSMASRLMRGIAKHSLENDRLSDELTDRELSVLRLVARGATNLEIAVELHITVNTVKSHLRNILEKLQLENRTQAAAYALEHGLANPAD